MKTTVGRHTNIKQDRNPKNVERKEDQKENRRDQSGSKAGWNVFLLLTLVFCMLSMVACGRVVEHTREGAHITTGEMTRSTEQSTADPNPDYLTSLTYSNLVDEATQNEVREAMLSAGLSQAAVDEFFKSVNEFNASIDNKTLVESGFVTVDTLSPEYDLEYMQQALEKKDPSFLGYNCRITTFELMKELVHVGNPLKNENSALFFDLDAIASRPGLMTPQELEEFKSFYGHIETERSADLNVRLNKVKEAYEKREIGFSDSTRARLISVYFHFDDGSEQPTIFIGHIGLLLPTSDGKWLFVEKLSFQEPYQAVKFDNRTQLSDYLMSKYDLDWGQETARPFIMENDRLMQGYRVIPNVEGEVPNGSGN